MYDKIIEERETRAKQHDERTRSQPSWYSEKANSNQQAFRIIGISIVILAAIVGIVPLISGGPPSTADKIVAAIGAVIVILKGVERIWLPEEKWMNYRKASEALLREKEKYVECIAPYDKKHDKEYDKEETEDELYKLYVERCILIRAEEQNNFWGISSGADKGNTSENNQQSQGD